MKQVILLLFVFYACNILHAAFPIVAAEPKISHEEAYRLLISEVTGKEFNGSYVDGIIPQEISYTCLERSKILQRRIETAPKENKNELKEKFTQYGWLIIISGYESLEHATAYFITPKHECFWIYTMD